MSSQVNAYSPRQGNALVELVVVITMLGVASSVALPRFTRLGDNVRATEVTALSANLRSASAAAHAQYLESGARLSSATLKGRSIQLKNGYPDAGTDGIGAALADVVTGFTVNVTPTSISYSKTDAPAPAQCTVTYRASPESGSATISDLKTSGC
jgi:type II secretory pathway pseudopilin PulG